MTTGSSQLTPSRRALRAARMAGAAIGIALVAAVVWGYKPAEEPPPTGPSLVLSVASTAAIQAEPQDGAVLRGRLPELGDDVLRGAIRLKNRSTRSRLVTLSADNVLRTAGAVLTNGAGGQSMHGSGDSPARAAIRLAPGESRRVPIEIHASPTGPSFDPARLAAEQLRAQIQLSSVAVASRPSKRRQVQGAEDSSDAQNQRAAAQSRSEPRSASRNSTANEAGQ